MEKIKRPSARFLPLLLLVLGAPTTVHAHTQLKGLGDFFGGMAHPVTTTSHLLILLGLGLWLGQHPPLSLKWPVSVFATVSALGLALTTTGFIKAVYPPILICIALLIGTLIALQKPLSRAGANALCAAAAMAIGCDSGLESDSTAAVIKTLFGTWLTLMLVVFDVAVYVSFCTKKEWQRIGIRVAGSWIMAISLLVLAFSLRKQ